MKLRRYLTLERVALWVLIAMATLALAVALLAVIVPRWHPWMTGLGLIA